MERLLADENFPRPSVRLLRDSGFDVLYIAEDFPSIQDIDVLELANRTERLLLTFDRDYGELIFKRGFKPKLGVIYLRLKDYNPDLPGQLVLEILGNPDIETRGVMTITDGTFIRQRTYQRTLPACCSPRKGQTAARCFVRAAAGLRAQSQSRLFCCPTRGQRHN